VCLLESMSIIKVCVTTSQWWGAVNIYIYMLLYHPFCCALYGGKPTVVPASKIANISQPLVGFATLLDLAVFPLARKLIVISV